MSGKLCTYMVHPLIFWLLTFVLLKVDWKQCSLTVAQTIWAIFCLSWSIFILQLQLVSVWNCHFFGTDWLIDCQCSDVQSSNRNEILCLGVAYYGGTGSAHPGGSSAQQKNICQLLDFSIRKGIDWLSIIHPEKSYFIQYRYQNKVGQFNM